MEKIILHVEDDDMKAKAVQKLLLFRIPNIVFIRVINLVDARRALENDKVDLVISDLDFPLTGLGVCHQDAGLVVEELARLRGVPIMFVSGREKPENVAAPWLTTPVNSADLTETVSRMLFDAPNAEAAG